MRSLILSLVAVLVLGSVAHAGNCGNQFRGVRQNVGFHANNFNNFNGNVQNFQQEFIVRQYTQRDGDVIGVTNLGREVFLGNVGVRQSSIGNFAGSFLGAFAGQAAFNNRRNVVIVNNRRGFFGGRR